MIRISGATNAEASDLRSFIVLLVIMATDGLGAGIIYPALPLLLIDLTGESVSRAAIYGGALSALFAISQFIAAPVLGSLSDRFGRRPVILSSLAAFGSNFLVMAVAPTLTWVFLGIALSGVFGATMSAANAYIVDTTAPDDRARRFGLIVAAIGAGLMLGPMLVGLLASFGPRSPFFAAAVLALLNLVGAYFMLPESLREANLRPLSAATFNPIRAVIQVRRHPVARRLLVTFALLQVAGMSVPILWSYFTILKFGWSQREVGMSVSFSCALIMIVQATVIGHVTRWLGDLHTVRFGICCMIVALLGFAFASRSSLLLAFNAPWALGFMTGAALTSYLTRNVSANSQGKLQGTVASVCSATSALTPILMTQVFNHFSKSDANPYFPGAPYVLAALFACIGLLTTMRMPRSYFV